MEDRRGDPGCGSIAAECLERIRKRWSVEEASVRAERQHRAQDLIRRCGHDAIPHEVPIFSVPDGSNEFDFEQLKWSLE